MTGSTIAGTCMVCVRKARRSKEVIIMGGVQDPQGFDHGGTFTTGPDGVDYLTPDTAANNAYDWPAAVYLYQALQGVTVIPSRPVSR